MTKWYYLDLIVTFMTFLWMTLDLNYDLLMNDTI